MVLRDRYPRKLAGNRSTSFPSNILYLDTETLPVNWGDHTLNRFRMAWTCHKKGETTSHRAVEDWKYWEDPLQLCSYIDALCYGKQTLVIYTHNAFFDLQAIGFFHHFPRWGWKLDFFYDKGLTYLFFITKGTARIKCVSTTNYFDFSLKKLGEDIGLEKLEVDFERDSDQTVKRYCRRDVEILVRSMEKYAAFNKDHDTGRFSYTKASQAFACYRHRFMDHPIMLHQLDKVVELERSAYFGGRTECWHIGKLKGSGFTFLDVNSMYPFVMQKYRYPSELLFYDDDPDIEKIKRYFGRACFVAEVLIETDIPAYAVRHNGKVCFPVGTFKTAVCTEGLIRAYKSKHLKKILKIAVYKPSELFANYVHYWYPLKAQYKSEGNALYTRIVKIFLNGLYGKFGQKKTVLQELDDPGALAVVRIPCFSAVTGEHWIELQGFGKRIFIEGEVNGDKSFVAIAAHVTEYSRFTLFDLCSAIGRERVYYMDTDSLVLRSEDLHHADRFIHPKRIGALSVDKVCTSLVLHGPKDYEIDGKQTTKGIPKSAIEVCPSVFQYTQFLGSSSHQRLGQSDGVLTKTVTKTLSRVYDKGIVQSNGRVSPLVFDQD